MLIVGQVRPCVCLLAMGSLRRTEGAEMFLKCSFVVLVGISRPSTIFIT